MTTWVTTTVIYLMLIKGQWQFYAMDFRPVRLRECWQLQEEVDRAYTGRDGNMKILCGGQGTEL